MESSLYFIIKEENMMEYAVLNNGVKMPMAGIGTFLLTPEEAEASVSSALQTVTGSLIQQTPT